jgi:hypothetical protein
MASKPPNNFPQRFVFHGNAVAAAVHLNRIGSKEQTVIHPDTGQSSLPGIGGRSESEILNPTIPSELKGIVSHGAMRTKAHGIFVGKKAVTTVEASVSEVSVINEPAPGESPNPHPIEFRAGTLSLSMSSTHPPKGQPRIEFVKPPQYDGMSLDGQPIVLELNTELMKLTRFDDLEHRFRTNRKFFDSCPFGLSNPNRPPKFGNKIPYTPGSYALCSIVRSITWGGRTIEGHVLTQRGFGKIYFGEMLLSDRQRRVTLVRMDLGSKHRGKISFACTDPNGTPIPP